MHHKYLHHLSLSGLDDHADLQELLDLQKSVAGSLVVEWGVLCMKGKRGGKYPSQKTVDKVRTFTQKGLNACIHLCGAYAKDILKGNPIPPGLEGFANYQLNIGSYQKHWDAVNAPVSCFPLPKEPGYKLQCGKNSWVLDAFAPAMRDAGYRVSILLDTSRGRGKAGANWDVKVDEFPCGFAGGITPGNLGSVLSELALTHPRFFVCLESGVRNHDRFDSVKVRTCIDACAGIS